MKKPKRMIKKTKSVCKNCIQCNEEFQSVNGKLTCSQKCFNERGSRNVVRYEKPDVSTPILGAINELKVCVDLMSKKYNVFRCVAPSSPFDIAIFKDNVFLKVEITTGTLYKNGRVSIPPKRNHIFDVLAVVVGDKIFYSPDNF